MAGNISNPSPSGKLTSEITTSPSPSSIQRHKVSILPVALTLHPARVNAWVNTALIVRSSSATNIVPSIIFYPLQIFSI